MREIGSAMFGAAVILLMLIACTRPAVIELDPAQWTCTKVREEHISIYPYVVQTVCDEYRRLRP